MKTLQALVTYPVHVTVEVDDDASEEAVSEAVLNQADHYLEQGGIKPVITGRNGHPTVWVLRVMKGLPGDYEDESVQLFASESLLLDALHEDLEAAYAKEFPEDDPYDISKGYEHYCAKLDWHVEFFEEIVGH